MIAKKEKIFIGDSCPDCGFISSISVNGDGDRACVADGNLDKLEECE